MGHPSVQKLRFAIPVTSSISFLGYESCKLGKHHRVAYPSQVTGHNRSPFKLVYYDVWGPSRVSSIKDFRYFMLFVDDFSRIT